MANLIANPKNKKTSTSTKKPDLVDNVKKWFKEQEEKNVIQKRKSQARTDYIRAQEAEAKARAKAQSEIKKFQKQISPKGVAAAETAARKAIEKKYPGMFVPQTRTKAGVKKVGKK